MDFICFWQKMAYFISGSNVRNLGFFDLANMRNFKRALKDRSLISPEQKSYQLKAHP